MASCNVMVAQSAQRLGGCPPARGDHGGVPYSIIAAERRDDKRKVEKDALRLFSQGTPSSQASNKRPTRSKLIGSTLSGVSCVVCQ